MDLRLRQETEKQRRVVTVTWVGSMAALLIYLLLPLLVGPTRIPEGVQPYRGFRTILWLVALVEVGVILWRTRSAPDPTLPFQKLF